VTACPLLSSHNMSGVQLMVEDGCGYGYIIMMIIVFTLPMTLTSVNVLLIYACFSL
jgi:hypothetical protein